MRKTLSYSVLAILCATGVQAQSFSNWQGFYTGIVLSSNSTDLTMTNSTAEATDTAVGLSFGYNHQLSGNWIIGAELAFSTLESDFGNTFSLTDERSVRARFGYATGQTFFYGTLGYAMADVNSLLNPADTSEVAGLLVGVGVEHMLTDRLSLRFEYLHRALSGDPIVPQINARQPTIARLAPQQVTPVNTDTSGGQVSLGITFHF